MNKRKAHKIHRALTKALTLTQVEALWLHLVTLNQKLNAGFKPEHDGVHVYLGDLRLTRGGDGWRAYRQRRKGYYDFIKEPVLPVLTDVLGGGA